MQQLRPHSLRDALTRGVDSGDRMLRGAKASVPFRSLLTQTGLGGARDGLAGRSVLITTLDQFAAALALMELDGLAGRIVLGPPDLKPEHFRSVLDRAEIDAVVTDKDPETLTGIDGVPVRPWRWPLEASRPVSGPHMPTEWVLLTSGTTGPPKMVSHSFAGLTAAIQPKAGPEEPPVWATFYDIRRYGGLQIFLRGVLGNGSMVLSSMGEHAADFLRRLGRHGATHVSGTPSHWRGALMSAALDAISPRYVRLSGEIADQAILDSLRAAYPEAGLGHAYASTEAGVGFEVDDGLEGFPASFVGRAGGDVELKVEDGSLRIRSTRAATSYVGSPGLDLADPEGFIDTGDMVERRGDRYYFVGRRDGVINVGGLKVHPEEVEAVINRHPHVRMSRVEGRRNPITGAIVVAAILLDGESERSSTEGDRIGGEILAACRAALPPHKVPALLRIVPSLDLTAAGKLARAHA